MALGEAWDGQRSIAFEGTTAYMNLKIKGTVSINEVQKLFGSMWYSRR